jgi:ion channel-forming bestrophin family protein
MIVRRTLPFTWFLQIDGWAVLFYILYGYGVCILNLEFFFEKLAFPFTGISVFGTAIAILLAFRNNSAYERYWEARVIWGDLTNYSRNFASQVLVYIRPPQGSDAQPEQIEELHREFIYRHLAFLQALRLQLREGYVSNFLSSFIAKTELNRLESVANKATQLNHWQAKRLQEVFDAGWIAPRAYVMGLMDSLKCFYIAQGK